MKEMKSFRFDSKLIEAMQQHPGVNWSEHARRAVSAEVARLELEQKVRKPLHPLEAVKKWRPEHIPTYTVSQKRAEAIRNWATKVARHVI